MSNIPDSQIAVTLYNLREYCKTEDDYAATLDKVAAMGYKSVQISGVPLPAEINITVPVLNSGSSRSRNDIFDTRWSQIATGKPAALFSSF